MLLSELIMTQKILTQTIMTQKIMTQKVVKCVTNGNVKNVDHRRFHV